MPKSAIPWGRATELHDTTIGWRFVNPKMQAAYGTDSMPETAQTLADEHGISRADQDAFALRSQTLAAAARRHGLRPLARVVGAASAGVAPRVMGYGPVPAVRKLLAQAGIGLEALDVIELDEAFAAQALAVTRGLGLADGDPRVNPNGGAIALGHPLGMSGTRIAGSVALELARGGGRYGLATMCVGVGQGAALLVERV
jgi:acetyl-CoA acetyltransferase